jgi:hypothetical protein
MQIGRYPYPLGRSKGFMRPVSSKGAGVFCKLANMLGFELFDLLCNLSQESGQGVRFVVANLNDQAVNGG